MSTLNNAIAVRERRIKQLRADPPIEWSDEYVQANIRIMENQIKMFKEFVGPIQED